jgi:ABC-type transport system involved in multi-copper enzyme maturation permease subunit
MLWRKAWLETRWRFATGLVVLSLLAFGNVFQYLAVERLLPGLQFETPRNATPLEGLVREAIEMQRTFRGFVFLTTFKQNLTQLGVVFAVLLGCGGLLAEAKKGSVLFTLALPVTRRRLMNVRIVTGLAQCLAIAMVPPLLVPVFAPAIGQQFSFVDALAHGLCLFAVGAVFYGLASFLSTLFADFWRPLLVAIVVACFAAVVQVIVPELGIFRIMSGETYFRTGVLPWMGLVTSAVLASALLYGAAEAMERKDF